jgi:hypothetical protein
MLSLHKAFLILGLFIASVAEASPIVLDAGHFTVTYDDVQAGLYGAGSVSGSGDTVFFTPTQFKTSSGSVSSALALTFTIDPGYVFTGLSYSESGDYFLLGGAAVNVTGSADAKNAATSALASLVLTSGASLDSVTTFANFHTTDWSLAGDLSLSGLGAPTTLLINLDNELFASTTSPGLGFIEKKFVGLQILTGPALTQGSLGPAAVPEPASWTLLLAGMMAAMWIRRRHGHGLKAGPYLSPAR